MKTRRDLIKELFTGAFEKIPGAVPSGPSRVQSPFFEFSQEMLYREAMKAGIDPSVYSEDELVRLLTEKMGKAEDI